MTTINNTLCTDKCTQSKNINVLLQRNGVCGRGVDYLFMGNGIQAGEIDQWITYMFREELISKIQPWSEVRHGLYHL